MTPERLKQLTDRFPSLRVVVVGDFFLDKYLDFDPALAEVSLETGKTANQVVNVRHSPGAAGTVVGNLVALGAGDVVPVGFTGDDGEGYELRQDLVQLGCGTDYLFCVPDRRTPTYLKPQDVSIPGLDGEQERYDTKNRVPLSADTERKVVDALGELLSQVNAVMIADQADEEECGVVTTRLRSTLSEMADRFPNVVFWADSRRRIGLFRNVIVKPNQQEAVRAVEPGFGGVLDDDIVLRAGMRLRDRVGKPVFITRSERGILAFDRDSVKDVPGVRVNGPTDPTGAGDSATAAGILTLAAGGAVEEAALMANLVASITVQQLGVTGTASPDELPARLELWREQRR